MIGERLDVQPDVLFYQRLAVNDLSVTNCVTSPVTLVMAGSQLRS